LDNLAGHHLLVGGFRHVDDLLCIIERHCQRLIEIGEFGIDAQLAGKSLRPYTDGLHKSTISKPSSL